MVIADCFNHRIMKWKSNESHGGVIASGNRVNQLNRPTDVIIVERNNSLIIADQGNKRVIRWSNENQQETLIDGSICSRLTMDKYEFLYVSDWEKNEVRRWKIGGKGKGKLVAGGNDVGDQPDRFNAPR